MFIKYQNVRNVLLAGVAVALGGIVWISCGSTGKNGPAQSDASKQEAPAPRTATRPAAPQPEVRPEEMPPTEALPVVPPKKPSPMDPMLARYRAAMRIAEGPADASGKGKDVLGPGNPWKLNLYDDDKDGKWDRGKLDYDRDGVDDEKWNFKEGRWEKEGGAKIWDGRNWIGAEK